MVMVKILQRVFETGIEVTSGDCDCDGGDVGDGGGGGDYG